MCGGRAPQIVYDLSREQYARVSHFGEIICKNRVCLPCKLLLSECVQSISMFCLLLASASWTKLAIPCVDIMLCTQWLKPLFHDPCVLAVTCALWPLGHCERRLGSSAATCGWVVWPPSNQVFENVLQCLEFNLPPAVQAFSECI